jgi:hypothetical protein
MNYATHSDTLLQIELISPLRPFPTTNHLMTISAAHGNHVYSAKFSSLQIKSQFEANRSNMNLDTFIDHTWNALLAKTPQHGCNVAILGSTARLELHFQVTDGISLNLGKLELQKVFDKTFMSIIKDMAASMNALQTKEKEYEDQIKKLKQGRDHVLQKYESFVKEKEMADTIIFKKFADVLNEKKRKIKELSQ